MKVLVINPNTTQAMTDAIREQSRLYARPDTIVEAVSPEFGPRSIEGYVEDYVSAVASLEVIAKTEGQYDAYVLACYGDPGIAAARELTTVPVIGIGEASMLMSCMLARKFSIVSVLHRIKPMLEELVRLHGMQARCASIRTTELSVLEIEEDYDAAAKKMIVEARKAIEEDGAEAILLGCAGMGPLDKRLEAELGVPVIDGCVAAVKLAEGLFDYSLLTSKVKAYKKPEPKEYVGDILQAIKAANEPARKEIHA